MFMNMKSIYFSVLTLIICSPGFAAERPNILLFTADDLHAESLGSYGSKAEMTPHLDRLAASGMVFNKAHVNAAICSPCRKIIATGLYGHNSGAYGFNIARPGTPTIINTFQKGGYLAGLIGKVPHSTPTKDTEWDFVTKDTANGRSPKLHYKHTADFLARCKKEKKPFYLMVNSHDPHRPYCEKGKLGHRDAEEPSRWYSPEEVEIPGFLPDIPQVRTELAAYQNSVRRLDDTFGKVMQALDDSGFADNTLVIFISDNGIAMPFAKANVWYHASRTPFLVRLPGVTKAGIRDDSHFVSVVDLFPTFLDLCGVKGPDKLDGHSFLPLLKGEKQAGRDSVYTQIDSLSSKNPYPMRCVQTAKFAYIHNAFSNGQTWYRNANEGKVMAAMTTLGENDPNIKARVDLFRHRVPEEFFDLSKDPDCLNNLIDSKAHADEIKKMRTRLAEYMKSSGDPLLKALENRDDRKLIDKLVVDTYGRALSKGKKKPKKK